MRFPQRYQGFDVTITFEKTRCRQQIPLYSRYVKVKVKQSRNRPGVAQRVPGGLRYQISWHPAREGGEVVSLTHRTPLPPGLFLVLIFTRERVDPRAMVRSEGNMSLKNPVTPPGIDLGTVRPVAQRLNHYATPDPYSRYVSNIIHCVTFQKTVKLSVPLQHWIPVTSAKHVLRLQTALLGCEVLQLVWSARKFQGTLLPPLHGRLTTYGAQYSRNVVDNIISYLTKYRRCW
jgi:hypothetical protein